MKTWDVIIIGGGLIGLSLSIELRKYNASVLLVERGEPGREASSAAAGMLADSEVLSPLRAMAEASARMYAEFVHELEDESGTRFDSRNARCDLRGEGTLYLSPDGGEQSRDVLSRHQIADVEPALRAYQGKAIYLKECSVDPQALTMAALGAAKHRGVDISSGSPVTEVLLSQGRVSGIRAARASFSARAVVNCAGAWAGQIAPLHFPTRPVRGQILTVVGGPALRHVIRSREVYLVPRTSGRLLIGSTLEEAGFDKRTDPDAIRKLHHAAINLAPDLDQARMIEVWAGLRPGTPDNLPILGETSIPGYFAAAGHFRDGILLAPITARLMAQLLTGRKPDLDISAFSISRFPETSWSAPPSERTHLNDTAT